MPSAESILSFFNGWVPQLPYIVAVVVVVALILSYRKSLRDAPKSPSIAGALSCLYPGLGHVYVGEYGWAVLMIVLNGFLSFWLFVGSWIYLLNPLYMRVGELFSPFTVILLLFVGQSAVLAFKSAEKYNHTRLQTAMYKELHQNILDKKQGK